MTLTLNFRSRNAPNFYCLCFPFFEKIYPSIIEKMGNIKNRTLDMNKMLFPFFLFHIATFSEKRENIKIKQYECLKFKTYGNNKNKQALFK